MRGAFSLLGPAVKHADAVVQDLPLVSVWLQHVLNSSCRSMHTSSSSLQQHQQGQQQPAQQQPHASPAWKSRSRTMFSVRPSVLSPLHPLHREIEDVEHRLNLLHRTMEAHLKLSEELHPKELQAYESSPDPTLEALKSRRIALQAVRDSYSTLLEYQVQPCFDPSRMKGYYGVLEGLLKEKDQGAEEFKQVLEGDRTVWDYWFQHFTPQYAGLPGLGSLERIYNQTDEEDLLQQMAQLRAVKEKAPPQPRVDHLGRAAAVGGRKTSVAQVYLWRGQGRILVNRKPIDAYFGDLLMRSHVLKPLMVTGLVDQVDVLIQVNGGGSSGQAQAAAHGIAKALKRLDPSLKHTLKAARLLKRDPRAVERKKFGKAKARKGFAWVKR